MDGPYMLIGCEILYREICRHLAACDKVVDFLALEKGLHDLGEARMAARLQEMIDAVDAKKYTAILLCYGLCNYGTKGLRADIPIVIPRAHDCITLLLGSKERYKEYFFANPGVYYLSSGWIERGRASADNEDSVPARLGMKVDFDAYDEDDAEYLKGILGNWVKNYSKYTLIDTGVGDRAYYADYARDKARGNGWGLETLAGDTGLIRDLVGGDWDPERFLVVPPGHTIKASYDDDIVAAAPVGRTCDE